MSRFSPDAAAHALDYVLEGSVVMHLPATAPARSFSSGATGDQDKQCAKADLGA